MVGGPAPIFIWNKSVNSGGLVFTGSSLAFQVLKFKKDINLFTEQISTLVHFVYKFFNCQHFFLIYHFQLELHIFSRN